MLRRALIEQKKEGGSPFEALRQRSKVGQGCALKTVCLLRSLSHSNRTYVGVTTDFCRRLEEHNSGKAPHTARFKPWEVVVVVEFSDDAKADMFERYLKSGSGHAFAKRHFW